MGDKDVEWRVTSDMERVCGMGGRCQDIWCVVVVIVSEVMKYRGALSASQGTEQPSLDNIQLLCTSSSPWYACVSFSRFSRLGLHSAG